MSGTLLSGFYEMESYFKTVNLLVLRIQTSWSEEAAFLLSSSDDFYYCFTTVYQTTARWRTFADKSADLCPRIIRKAPHRIRADVVRTWIDFCGCGTDMDLNFKIYADAVRTWLKCCGCGADADCVPWTRMFVECPRMWIVFCGHSVDVDHNLEIQWISPPMSYCFKNYHDQQ